MTGNSIESVSMEDLAPLFRECLSHGQSVRFSPKGTSMLPLLRQKIDSVVLSPLQGNLRKYDIALYQRKNGQYVLHRVVQVGQTYTCIGDNQHVLETGLEHSQMIAVVTSFYRGERQHSVTELWYRLYCRAWHYSRDLRYFWHRGVRWLKRHLQ